MSNECALAAAQATAQAALEAASETVDRLAALAAPVGDRPTTLNVRMRSSTIAAITAMARERGLTIKQVLALALALVKDDLAVDPLDLEDRTPRRRTAA